MITKTQSTLTTLIAIVTLLCCNALPAQSTQPAGGSAVMQSSTNTDAGDAEVSEEDAQAIAEHVRNMQGVLEQRDLDQQNDQQRQGGQMFDQKQSVVAKPAVPAQPIKPAAVPAVQSKTDRNNTSSKQAAPTVQDAIVEPTFESLKPEVVITEKAGNAQGDVTTQTPGKVPAKIVVPNLVPSRQPWEYYKPLVERNIFTRTQLRSSSERDRTQTSERTETTTPTAPKSSWVLTGIVIHAQGNYAFFENSLTNVTLRVTAGQSLGESRVTSIASDHVIAAAGDSEQTVAIGTTIDGSTATLGAARSGSVFGESTPPAEGATTPAGASSSTPLDDPSKMSIVERMRARRLQESSK